MWNALLVLWLIGLVLFLGACRTAPSLVRVDGDSMLPALHDGQLVFIDTLTRDFAAGDIVLIRTHDLGPHTIHRIVWISDTEVCTKGDGNDDPDVVRPRSRILGKAFAQ